ncbi:MAG: proteasome accessory factor PafA2 [bacterium]|nr:proteasome accessory factor PafA2 [bacterium]
MGTETEFGITVLNQADFNPVAGASTLVNSYAGKRARIKWSSDEESPGRDARGFGYDLTPAFDLESGLVNVVLGNGARFYVDHAHPEYSSPESADPLEAALYDKAGEVILARAVTAAQELLEQGQRFIIHKNNSDGKGNSYGAHENYLISRALPFGQVVQHLTGFFATRQIFTGSGKVGAENGRPDVDFQISQRADFFEEEVGLETTLKRPIINTRDEPHADPSKYRRLHVIIGDATMSEVQTFVKLAATTAVLHAIEDDALPEALVIANPVDAVWQISHDPTLRTTIDMEDGRSMTALEAQWQYLEWVGKYVSKSPYAELFRDAMTMWEEILADLEKGPMRTADRLDWTAKQRILEGYRSRDDLEWDDPKLRLLDLQYHDVAQRRGLYNRLAAAGRMRRLFTDAQIDAAVRLPPEGTRAYFRGKCVTRFGDALVAANWDSLVFDIGEESLRRVPMMEPLRGGKDRVGALLDRVETPAELLQALGGNDD